MDADFEWDRLLLAIALIALMFIVPALVIWRDQRADLRRHGLEALTRPIRYTPDGRSYREGLPLPGDPTNAGKDRQRDAPTDDHATRRPDGRPCPRSGSRVETDGGLQ